MKICRNSFAALLQLSLLGLLLSACQSTAISTAWRDESFSRERIGKVFIISLLKNDLLRRKTEDAYTAQFRLRGVDALASYKAFPTAKEVDRGEVVLRMRREGCSSVLVVRPQGVKTVTVNNTPTVYTNSWYGNGWYPYYREVYYTAPTYVDVDIAKVETAIFDLESEKPLWAAQTETELISAPTDKDIEEGVKLIITAMLGK